MMVTILRFFRNKWGNDNSLINNHIITLNGDSKDRVWIGTQKGISYFDYTDTKIHSVYYLNNAQNKVTAAIIQSPLVKMAMHISQPKQKDC